MGAIPYKLPNLFVLHVTLCVFDKLSVSVLFVLNPALLLHRALPVLMTEHVVEKRQLVVLVSWKPDAQDAAQLDMANAGMLCCS